MSKTVQATPQGKQPGRGQSKTAETGLKRTARKQHEIEKMSNQALHLSMKG